MPGQPSVEPSLRDDRVPPSGVLPKNTQAWLLAGVAIVMVLVIALSGHNAPQEKKPARVPPVAPAESNAAQIREYQSELKAETQKLQIAKDQVSNLQGAYRTAVGAGGAQESAFGGRGGPRPPSIWAASTQPLSMPDTSDMQDKSLFASNVALSFRAIPQIGAAPAAPSVADAVANALAPYTLRTPYTGSPVSDASAPSVPPASNPPKENSESANNKRRAERDAKINRADGKEYRLFEGTVIETVLTNRLDGTFNGPVDCLVTTGVYSHNGQHVLIPEGSRVLGEARKVETFGERRLAVVFHRLIMPDGYSVSLDQFQGLNQIGETGLQDQINHHYVQIFGVSLALGAIAGFSQANTSYGIGESAADAYRQGAASSLAQSSTHILDRYLNLLPTITIREGHRVKVYLSDDLLLPGYETHRMPNDL